MSSSRHPAWNEEHEHFRKSVRAFVDREIAPHVDAWDEAGAFPRELYEKAGELGILGVGFPEEYGGTPADAFMRIIVAEELARTGSGGVSAGLMSHAIGAPPIAKFGSEDLKRRLLAPILAGEKVCALAITEPGGGSDVANLKTRARLDGDTWILDGEKTFITSGMRADVITVAARTGGAGMGGISLFAVEGDAPGLERSELKKTGWWSSDTATLRFDGCRVPASNLIGEENAGFLAIMANFNDERLHIATLAIASAQVCYDEALAWAKQRETFGKPLVRHQVIRHKLVDMLTSISAARAMLDQVAYRVDEGEWPIAEVCMLKNVATRCVEHCAKEAVQILGGSGYIRGHKVERIYRETKVLAIGGGAEEIMKELAAKQLGIV